MLGPPRRSLALILALMLSPLAARAYRGDAPPLPVARASAGLGAALRARAALGARDAARRRRMPPMFPVGGNGLIVETTAGALSFDLLAGTIAATTQLSVRNDGAASVAELYLYVDPFKSGTLGVKDKDGDLQHFSFGNLVEGVTLRQPLAAGQSVILTVTEQGQPDCTPQMLSVSSCMVDPGLTYNVSTSWMPMLLDAQTGALFYALKATFAVTVPPTHQVAANGLAVGTTTNTDGTLTFSFASLGETTFAFSAAPFVMGSTAFGAGQSTTSYVLQANAGQAASWRDAVVDIITFHGERYGVYDLPKIDFAEVSDQAGAAFGPLSTVFIPSSVLGLDGSLWADRITLAHELGHQWFGGFIRDGDSYSPWLNEGFASFAEMEYTSALAGKLFGVDYAPTYREAANLRYIYTVLEGTDVPLSSSEIYNAPSDVYIAVTYDKGGLVGQMMRHLLGETEFFAAMKRYRADHVDKAATVSSLVASIKASSGKDLTAFMDTWAYAAGYPVCRVGVLRSQANGLYQTQVTVAVDRDPQMPIELELVTADGQRERKQLTVSGGESGATYETSREVLQVRFDPDRQLVGRSRGALVGDVYLDGEVDGLDLIYAAAAQGERYAPRDERAAYFSEWADLVFDGAIDPQDLDMLLASFGKSGQGG